MPSFDTRSFAVLWLGNIMDVLSLASNFFETLAEWKIFHVSGNSMSSIKISRAAINQLKTFMKAFRSQDSRLLNVLQKKLCS